ncbi:MAG: hypothetical protein MUD10_02680 [Candidatus Pacebacteria bacterium]|nr:hypothetical protein [Candidatus Paceibacterota bacterium]
MVELIASILFIGSAAGVVAIAAKKMPALNEIPEKSDLKVLGTFGAFKKWLAFKVKSNPKLKDLSWIDLAQKTLIKGRVIVLKTENKLNEYMVKLRQRAESQQKEKEALLDNYWHDLKTIVKTKKIAVGKNPKGGVETLTVARPTGEATVHSEISEFPAEEEGMKTVFPEESSQKHHHKKKKHSGFKKRFRDPFSW